VMGTWSWTAPNVGSTGYTNTSKATLVIEMQAPTGTITMQVSDVFFNTCAEGTTAGAQEGN
ncbi:hypothetical protein Sste5346_006551, partial [Sporothrix stenoceras]